MYKNKYRGNTARLQSWDYGSDAAYFITICTYKKVHRFGKIKNGKMELSALGKIAAEHWEEIPERFPYCNLDVYVIMPNHMHGIVIIDHPSATHDLESKKRDTPITPGCAINRAPTEGDDMSKPGGATGTKNPMLHDNLSRVIRWYKGRVCFESRKIDSRFTWQSRFYDNIIRNNRGYTNIKNYIINL